MTVAIQTINSLSVLEELGQITWMLNANVFFIETPKGNFIYSDSFHGDNTLRKTNHSYNSYVTLFNKNYSDVLDEGIWKLIDFCDQNVQVLDD